MITRYSLSVRNRPTTICCTPGIEDLVKPLPSYSTAITSP